MFSGGTERLMVGIPIVPAHFSAMHYNTFHKIIITKKVILLFPYCPFLFFPDKGTADIPILILNLIYYLKFIMQLLLHIFPADGNLRAVMSEMKICSNHNATFSWKKPAFPSENASGSMVMTSLVKRIFNQIINALIFQIATFFHRL